MLNFDQVSLRVGAILEMFDIGLAKWSNENCGFYGADYGASRGRSELAYVARSGLALEELGLAEKRLGSVSVTAGLDPSESPEAGGGPGSDANAPKIVEQPCRGCVERDATTAMPLATRVEHGQYLRDRNHILRAVLFDRRCRLLNQRVEQ